MIPFIIGFIIGGSIGSLMMGIIIGGSLYEKYNIRDDYYEWKSKRRIVIFTWSIKQILVLLIARIRRRCRH